MKLWIIPALILGTSVAIAADYGSSTPGPASKPSSGAVGSGQAADKGRTGADAAKDAAPSTTSMDEKDKKGKAKKGEGKKGEAEPTAGKPSSGSVGSGEPAPGSGKGPGAGMGGGTGAREGTQLDKK